MTQLHIVDDIRSQSGGLGLAALQYANSLAILDENIILYSALRFDDEWTWDSHTNFKVMGLTAWNGKSRFRILFEQIAELCTLINSNDIDIIHIHGCWSPLLFFGKLLAKYNKIKYIVSPHGSLEPWALNHKWLKKKIAYLLYQKKILLDSSMIVVTSDQEFKSIRALGVLNSIAIIPLGISNPTYLNNRTPIQSKKSILFLSRIHQKKGIEDLLIAWSFIRDPNWKIVIAGTGETFFIDQLKNKVKELELSADIEFIGEVVGDKKETVFSEASIFALPSYSENFGIVVGESLIRGIPVITTNKTPWHEILDEGCGWYIEPGVQSLQSALTEAISNSPESLANMGARGREFILKNYTLDMLGHKALAVSQLLLKQCEGQKLAFIRES